MPLKTETVTTRVHTRHFRFSQTHRSQWSQPTSKQAIDDTPPLQVDPQLWCWSSYSAAKSSKYAIVRTVRLFLNYRTCFLLFSLLSFTFYDLGKMRKFTSERSAFSGRARPRDHFSLLTSNDGSGAVSASWGRWSCTAAAGSLFFVSSRGRFRPVTFRCQGNHIFLTARFFPPNDGKYIRADQGRARPSQLYFGFEVFYWRSSLTCVVRSDAPLIAWAASSSSPPRVDVNLARIAIAL